MKGRLNSNRFFQFTKNVLGRHTGEAIAKKIEQLLKEVPHVENLEVVDVHDSAANMKNGMQRSNIIHRSLPCSDHLLNFAILQTGAVTACPEMNSAVERCTALASKSHKSTLAKQRI